MENPPPNKKQHFKVLRKKSSLNYKHLNFNLIQNHEENSSQFQN